MKHTKLLVVALLVVLLASLTMVAMADETTCTSKDATNGLHKWIMFGSPVPASCEDAGKTTYICLYDDCNETKVEFTPAKGHKWGNYEQYKAATCVAPGVQMQRCQNIDPFTGVQCTHWNTASTRYEPAATGVHSWQPEDAPTAKENKPTCTVAGNKALRKCTVCGAVHPVDDGSAVSALGHNFDGAKWQVAAEATCAEAGVIYRECTRTGCSYKEYQYTEKDATHNGGKDWVETIPAKPAGCTTTGCKAFYSCKTCGATKGGEIIPASGHDLNGVAWEPKNSSSIPDCIHGATIVRRCRTCGDIVESQEVPATGVHTWSKDPILPLTDARCEYDGCKAVYQCLVCGATTGGEKIPAKGHKFVWEASEQKDATCTENGVNVSKCSVCGKVLKVVIPATGHSATWIVAPGSDASKGYVTWILRCNLCKTVIASQVVRNGETAPSGTVQTGKAQVDDKYTATAKGVVETAKNETKKTETKKTTTKTSTAKKSTNTTSTAKAAPKTETKAATTAAVVTAEAPAFAKLSAINLFKEYDIDGTKVTLNDDFTYTAELADGQIVALFVDEAALAAPAEGNFLALSAEEAVEIPEGFEPTLIAVVTEASLPTAQAAK